MLVWIIFFGLYQSTCILQIDCYVSGAKSVTFFRRGVPTQMDLLERANQNHCMVEK
jgi:hypothetical protein